MRIKRTGEYIELAKNINKIRSDNALAKICHTSHTSIGKIKNDKWKISDIVAKNIADLLNIDPMEIIAASNYWAGEEKDRQYWEEYYQKNFADNPKSKMIDIVLSK